MTSSCEGVSVRHLGDGSTLSGVHVEETRALPPIEPEEKDLDLYALMESVEGWYTAIPAVVKWGALLVCCVLGLVQTYEDPREELRVALNTVPVSLLALSPFLTSRLTSLWSGYYYPDRVEDVLHAVTDWLRGQQKGVQRFLFGLVMAATIYVSRLSSGTVWVGCLSIYAIACAVPAVEYFV
ncbi:hypothetical protein KIPB_007601 [Kipferlia bialata]|uniref:Uncharacterized protein n=1 Tax=Kipferlia bialata TaxID=797122 RepID=A0A9K3GKT6_9EUKA|nr:hypothetical protein KIPB_007601 [Kipferlia bialata]|eukprot:g7601.t1